MLFFHISDLHLGRQFYGYNLIEDQRFLLEQIIEKVREHHPQLLLISGDVYDKPVPTQEAVALFDDFLTSLKKVEENLKILIIAGNHDSAARLQFANKILKNSGIIISGTMPNSKEEKLVEFTLSDSWGEVNFVLCPYFRLSYVRKLFDENVESNGQALEILLTRQNLNYSKRNVLLTHQFYTWNSNEPLLSDSETKNVGGLDNLDVRIINQFDYVAMGHIHRPQQLKEKNIRYSGSLMKYSLSEAEHKKSFVMVELKEKGTVEVNLIPLNPLHDIKLIKGSFEEILDQYKSKCSDYVSVTLTNPAYQFDVKEKLQTIFENLIEVKLDNSLVQNIVNDMLETEVHNDAFEIIEQFYHEQYGENMEEEEKAYLQKVFKEIQED